MSCAFGTVQIRPFRAYIWPFCAQHCRAILSTRVHLSLIITDFKRTSVRSEMISNASGPDERPFRAQFFFKGLNFLTEICWLCVLIRGSSKIHWHWSEPRGLAGIKPMGAVKSFQLLWIKMFDMKNCISSFIESEICIENLIKNTLRSH